VVKQAKQPSRWRRRGVWAGLVLLAWLALSQFVVRPAIRAQLERRFAGEATIRFAIVWPNLVATSFGVRIEAKHHTLRASRVSVDINPMALFGDRLVDGIHVADLVAEIDEGERIGLFRPVTPSEGAAASGDDDLDPVRVAPLTFSDPAVVLRDGDSRKRVFSAAALTLTQTGEGAYGIDTEPGVLAGIPFEKLTARMMPRGDRLILGRVKMRSFGGVIAGFFDVDLRAAGRLNGELEWYVLEAERIWRHYDLWYAEKRRGDLSGRMVFSAHAFSPRAFKGTGTVRLAHAEFFSPLSFKVFLVLKIPAAQEAPIHRAEFSFSFEKGVVYLEKGRGYAREFDLAVRGLATFEGEIDLEVRHAGTTVAVRGPMGDPSVHVLLLDAVTLPFDRLFRERIRDR